MEDLGLKKALTGLNPSFWKLRNVFVTGASGFLGGWTVKMLLELGANVVCLIKDEVEKSDFYQSGLERKTTLVHGALENYETLERALNEYDINMVLHLAAQTQVTVANRNPLSTFESNIKGSWCLLEACRRNPQVERIVMASSDKAYGTTKKLPYKEDTELEGTFPYDLSKACAERIAIGYAQTFGLNVAITRCGNFYGGGDLNFHRIIPGTIRDLIHGRTPVLRSNGKMIREYFHVLDVARAYLTLAERMEGKKYAGEAFNFGSDNPKDVLEVVKAISKAMGTNGIKPKILGTAKHEIPAQYLDSAKARKLLKWKPVFSFEEGLALTVAWYRNYFASAR